MASPLTDDPALLFTPTKPAVAGNRRREVLDFIQPPTMASAERRTYKPRPQSSLPLDPEFPADEIIGEYQEGKQLWYYARYMGGIAHRFGAEVIGKKYPNIIAEYERRRLEGELKAFDPNASYVHPKSRVRISVSIGKNGASANTISSNGSAALSSDVEEVPDSEPGDDYDEDDEDDKEEKEDGDEYEEHESPIKVRRSSRTTKLPQKVLPFSPKKTRSQRIAVLDTDEDEEEDEAGSTNVPTRRSTRARKGFKVKLDRGAYYESEQEDDDSEADDAAPRPKATVKKRARNARGKGAGVRPAYGHIRSVADLDYDPDSDEDTAALREHRNECEKCHMKPAHELLEAERKRPKAKGRKRRKTSDDDLEESGDEVERITKKGGWVRCLKCPSVTHWSCLAATQRDEILKAARDIDRAAWRSTQPESDLQDENGLPKPNKNEPSKRAGLEPHQTTDFVCGACTRGGVCMGCMEVAIEPDNGSTAKPTDVGAAVDKDVIMTDTTKTPSSTDDNAGARLLFRCLLCKRVAHYEHLPLPSDLASDSPIADIAEHYQITKSWLCADCSSFTFGLDKILAWRPYPATAVEPPRPLDEPPHYKTPLPREYLVKWVGRSYRRTQWVPHMWLVSTNGAKLKNFLAGGSKVELLNEAAEENAADNEGSAPFQIIPHPQDAMPDAERKIPLAWKTVDRVLDLLLWRPHRSQPKARRRVDDDSDEAEDEVEAQREAAFVHGEQPGALFTETLEEWEVRTKQSFSVDEHIDDVAWIFVKWEDLTYDEATWDSPPRSHEHGYPCLQTGSSSFSAKFDKRVKDGFSQYRLLDPADLKIGQDPAFKLMEFQMDGFNWLCDNWWNHQHCILADEMGLGKTVQIATFIGKIIQDFEAAPALVVVPNSTITNWVREFERWAPNLRVVPFYGEAKARDVIINFELSHSEKQKGFTNAKFHVLVTTYEAFMNPKEFTPVFKNQPRWEVVVIDEGQRLKNNDSLLFRKLNELKSIHRIIMTGTPLNNNIRELFNLMNFLDPAEWDDLEALEREHETLTEDLIKQLHNRLRPYFLRRIKSEVLKLPPKNEVIVPVSMAPLQKEVYRSILSHNLDLLNGLSGPKANGRGKLNNVLMHLRKCLQHPYLYEESIEPRGLPQQETHEKLIDASAKLRFLKVLLPKLKSRGHRVLLFSQFVIALDIIQDFLQGEGLTFLRLDGGTKGSERQKGMDEFNRAGSDVFIYLLTTRAGGVGINLFTADTVIIFDPDFNPHQAIARAYRYGQKNTCLVFKLMVRGTDGTTERIVQVGKKKLVLDHLIVQKMDDDDDAGDNVQSILTYGAQALFEADADARDIIYTDADVDKLIDKTEQEAEPEKTTKEGVLSFAFAKIWAAEKDALEEVVEEEDQGDSWAQTLQKITADREKTRAQEVATTGRGARRRAAAPKQNAYLIDASPVKGRRSTQSAASDDSAYGNSSSDSEDDATADASSVVAESLNGLANKPRKTKKVDIGGPLPTTQILDNSDLCALCGLQHGNRPGECLMTQESRHLAEFRELLILHSDDEPLENRLAAISAIDEVLHQRGHMALILNQPLDIVERSTMAPPTKKSKSQASPQNSRPSVPSTSRNNAAASSSHQPPQTAPIASSSKRPPSPTSAEYSQHKKSRPSSAPAAPCVICGSSPHHLVKDCPIVNEGPKRVSREIKRLEDANAHASTVLVLRKILAKQKKQELAPDSIIYVSD
ncbi:SNF2 family DNA-dependent ATPase [Mycena rebaudengoi]|nr:SNF2 family DNA-dependent ATPase [Mycena rebaudengoi]